MLNGLKCLMPLKLLTRQPLIGLKSRISLYSLVKRMYIVSWENMEKVL